MSIKAGAILHSANGFVVDRIQTGGVSNLNIPQEKIYELGNWRSVATVYDTPELTFDMESFDVSSEIEAILTGVDPASTSDGDEFDFLDAMPLDVISPFKSNRNNYDIVRGIAVPYLTLESATYRFGVRQNSTQAFSFRGDTINYIPGSPYFQEETLGGANSTYNFDHTAIPYVEQGNTLYALSVCVRNSTTHAFKRLFIVNDYTNTNGVLTILDDHQALYDTVAFVYGSTVAATYSQAVHENVSVKPAAVRGKDVCVYLSTADASTVLDRWTGAQSVEVNWRVNLEADEELCNPKYVTQDYDTPDVAGNIAVKPVDPADLWAKIAQVAAVDLNEIAGPYTTTPLEMEVRINHPDTGDTLKTIYVPDARFTIPGVQGRVQQKTTVTFPFTSDGGTMLVYEGERP